MVIKTSTILMVDLGILQDLIDWEAYDMLSDLETVICVGTMLFINNEEWI